MLQIIMDKLVAKKIASIALCGAATEALNQPDYNAGKLQKHRKNMDKSGKCQSQ